MIWKNEEKFWYKMKNMLGSILLWIPTIIVNIAKLDGVYIKYVLVVCAVIFVTIVTSTLGYPFCSR